MDAQRVDGRASGEMTSFDHLLRDLRDGAAKIDVGSVGHRLVDRAGLVRPSIPPRPTTDDQLTVMDARDFDGRAIGEITSVDSLLRDLRVDASDTFLDIGSGRGNIVIQCAQREVPPALSCGIEIIPARHEMAVALAATHLGVDTEARERVHFACGDALSADHRKLLQSATKVFINNLLFDANTNAAFANAFSREQAPKMVALACTKPIVDPATERRALQAVGLFRERTSTIEANYGHKLGEAKPLYIYARAPIDDRC